MAMGFKTKLTRDEYLKALGLFTIAHDRYTECGQFAEALNRLIMVTPEKYPGGHVDDAIYSGERSTVADFDEALRRQGIEVEAE